MNQFASGVGIMCALFATLLMAYDHCVGGYPAVSGWVGIALFLVPVVLAFAAGRLTLTGR